MHELCKPYLNLNRVQAAHQLGVTVALFTSTISLWWVSEASCLQYACIGGSELDISALIGNKFYKTPLLAMMLAMQWLAERMATKVSRNMFRKPVVDMQCGSTRDEGAVHGFTSTMVSSMTGTI